MQMFLFPVCLCCPQVNPFIIILSIYVSKLWVHQNQPFTYKLLMYTNFPHFVRKSLRLYVCMCVYACANLRLHACMHSHPSATSQTIWSTRQISIERLCGHWPYTPEGPILFRLHFPSWIIQHGGHMNFWVGHDNEHHICSGLDIMYGGRIVKNFYLTWGDVFGKGC